MKCFKAKKLKLNDNQSQIVNEAFPNKANA